MKRGSLAAALILFCAVSAISQGAATAEAPTSILLISSSISLDRVYSISKALSEAWRKREPKAEVFTHLYPAHYIGTTEEVNRRSQETLLDLIAARKPKIIVTHGNQALDLVISLRASRYPRIPIISLEATGNVIAAYEKEPNTYHLVMPRADLSNFKLAYTLFPDTKRAVFLIKGDNPSVPPEAYAKELVASYPEIEFKVLLNPSPETVDPVLVSAEKTVLIVFTPGWRNSDGRYVYGAAFIRELVERYNLPVFTFIRDYLDSGMVGGMGLPDAGWGRAAAEMGLSILLDGRSIPAAAVSFSIEQAFVDYRVLRRFGIPLQAVPEGVEIANKPPAFWDRYKWELQVTGILLILTVAALLSYLFVRRKERALLVRAKDELEKKVDERTRELMSANDELSFSNENLVEAIRRAEAMKENVLKTERAVVLGRLAAGFAHNLNTPLGAISSANQSLRSVAMDERAGLCRQMMYFTKKQSALFERYVDRILAREVLEDTPEHEACLVLEARLKSLGCRASVQVAADLFDAGLSTLGVDELKAFAGEDSAVVASVLFRISVLLRSSWIIESAVSKAAAAIDVVREYGGGTGEKSKNSRVDIQGTVKKTLDVFKSYIPDTILVVRRFRDVPPVLASEQPLIRLWSHLIMNAIQAMPEGGTLCIDIECDKDTVLVHIEDDGAGIPAAIKDSLFDPFVTTRPLAEAMGLGLAYCKKIVEELSGTIGYSSKEKGTIFTVSIPVGGTS